MKRLTYRGVTYSKSSSSSKEHEILKRLPGLPHTYRGAIYHYGSEEKELDSYLNQHSKMH